MNQLSRNIPSTEVAEMVGRDHNEVLKDLRRIIAQLGEGNLPQSYFIESTYTNSQNKQQPCFLLTKKGCELYGTRMTGKKGTQFAVKYIERFNEMEQHIEKQLSQDPITLALESALNTRKQLQSIQMEVVEVKETVQNLVVTMRIDGNQESQISKRGREVVIAALGGKESNAYKKISRQVFSAFWRDFKNHFEVPRYGEIPKTRFAESIKFISMWQPSTTLRMEINAYNQQALKLVEGGAK
ncbi:MULTISPECIES: Rha family transcriptional regulator [Lysinibacillus]|uniref:Rha family transcriptional regulator n=1 Tax=Lysinibacillus TaxID=400634 RepID=UPI00214B5D11|nr:MULTISPECIES: Rha family transcriptional regulator [Lysinibacillus]UUV27089.1 ORF6C domain-containing protein [Lysinibacillus sp. FN11]UYB45350.1 ORF6C domain-containing protein [Lysinibacillus capsici]